MSFVENIRLPFLFFPVFLPFGPSAASFKEPPPSRRGRFGWRLGCARAPRLVPVCCPMSRSPFSQGVDLGGRGHLLVQHMPFFCFEPFVFLLPLGSSPRVELGSDADV